MAEGSNGSPTGKDERRDDAGPLTSPAAVIGVEDVWVEFGAGLRAFVRRRVADPHEAEDLLGEIVVRVHRNLDTLEDHEQGHRVGVPHRP